MSTSEHDRLFRATFQSPEHALGLLKPLVPAAIAARIDWSTLKLESGSFVDEASSRYADLLFSVRTLDDQRPVLIYALTEHQSSAEPLMAMRMAGYVVRALERYAAAHPGLTTLPAVIPIVVSHCEVPWTAAPDLGALYDLSLADAQALGAHLLDIRYIVYDLTSQTAEGIRRRALTARATVTLLALRAVRIARDFVVLFAEWADLLQQIPQDELAPLLVYALQMGEGSPEALRDVLRSRVSPATGDLVMSTAERLIEEGVKLGEARGEARGMARMLLGFLAGKSIEVPPAVRERIFSASAEELDCWARRVIDAATLDEVFDPED